MQHRLLGCALVIACMAGCTTGRSRSIGQDPSPSRPGFREGVYAVCAGAYAHVESLTLRGGTFEHIIQTHGLYGARSRGSYELVGDTVVVHTTDTDTAIPGVRQPLRLNYDFVVGEYAGLLVLWRGTADSIRSVGETKTMSEYAALFYGGPEPARREIPSCEQVRQKLRASSSE